MSRLGFDLGFMGKKRIKLIRQTEVTECGLAALAMIANYYGAEFDLGTARRAFRLSTRGAALTSLMANAEVLGLGARAVKVPLEQLNVLQLPAILHWDLNHYVVLEEIKSDRLLIHDPAGVSRWIRLGQVSNHFTGIALELSPNTQFEQFEAKRKLRLSQLWGSIRGLRRAIAQTIILSIVLQAFVLTSPYYMQVGLDSALPALDKDLVTVLAIGFGLFSIINAIAALLRSFVLLSAGTAIGYGIASNVGRRLLRLPISWFERRHVGDILSRFQSIQPIRQFLTEGAIAAALDGLLAVITLCVMLFYSVTLSVVAIIALSLNILLRSIMFSSQKVAQDYSISAAGREQSVMIESLRGIVALRIFGKESSRQAVWQARLMDSMNANVSLARITSWQSAFTTLITTIELVISTWLSLRMIIYGGFSVGMMFAYIAYKTQFMQKGLSLVDQYIIFRMIGLHLERISDVALEPEDYSFTSTQNKREFKGKIELINVCFRYSNSDPYILNNLSLTVAPGEHIAITGPSGGGKSTLIKIMLGILEPESGQVLIDDIPLKQFGYRNFHDQIGAVMQDDQLFAGSFSDNICMFDDYPNQQRILGAAGAASLHGDIASMPMGYESLIGDMGSTLSGGQKQRLLLARALYRNPRLLLIDEGTAHLDPTREQAVNEAIAQLGITKIVVAHRIETILCAERAVTLSSGRIEVFDKDARSTSNNRFVKTAISQTREELGI